MDSNEWYVRGGRTLSDIIAMCVYTHELNWIGETKYYYV